MMSESNNIYLLSDSAIIEELGRRLKQLRISKKMSQEALATAAGLDRTTIVQLENGRPASVLTLVQILRALGKLEIFDNLLESQFISPIQAAKSQLRIRKNKGGKPGENISESTW